MILEAAQKKSNVRTSPQAPPPEIWDEYKLARLFGWTPQEIEDAPAHWCDWALQIADVESKVRNA